jgi:hypothetical protein
MMPDERCRPDDRGLWRDGRGRILPGFPSGRSFRVSSDDSLGALEEAIAYNEDEATAIELMHREVDRGNGGSKGRRRSPKAKPVTSRVKDEDGDDPGVRRGRPVIGAEARVRFHTSIAQHTRTMLIEGEVTLAEVFDASARRLRRAHGG